LSGKADHLIGDVTLSEQTLTGGRLLICVRVDRGRIAAWELDYVGI